VFSAYNQGVNRAISLLIWLLLASGCNKDSGGGTATPAVGSAVASAPAKGSAGGFSADLANPKAGSAAPVDPKAGSAAPVDPKAGSAAPVDPKAGSAMASGAKAGSATTPSGAKAGSATAASATDAKAGSAASATPATKLPTSPSSVVIESGAGPRTPVSVSPELRAINISLLPNWERDVEAAGTISFRVKIPNRTESALFVFRYGYEDPKAPSERDAYKKWLVDSKLLTPKDDRQAGGAWYIEGTDARGKPAFRFVINYGGKKLICHGSLYKDAASNALGDLRDQTILQAKQICETLAL